MKTMPKALVTLSLLGAAIAAQAVPVTYTMTVDNVTATANGVGVGPGASVVIVINADTTAVVVAGAGHCVPGTSGSISINGGAVRALTGAYFVCANNVGDNVGVYSTLAAPGTSPVHGGNTGGGTGALTGAPAVDLISNLGPVSYIANTLHSHGGNLSLLAGGTYSATAPEQGGTPNTTASNFQVALGAVAPATPASIPTLSEWGVILLSGLVGLAVFGMSRKRRS